MIWKSPELVGPGPVRPTLFLDRDGVVIVDRDYLADPARVELVPGAAAAMVRARRAGFQIVGVSNQSGIGRGYFTIEQFEDVMVRLEQLLAEEGARYDGFYYCPHAPEDACSCRKPAVGLLREAAQSFAWRPERSWVVGDKGSDIALGRAGGLGSVLVRTGYGAAQVEAVRRAWPRASRIAVADDLAAAIDVILRDASDGDTP